MDTLLEWLIVLAVLQSVFWPKDLYLEIKKSSCYVESAWAGDSYPVAREKCTVMPLVRASEPDGGDSIHLKDPPPTP